MQRSGAWLAVHALENLGVRLTFGIPGVHNTELYDELHASSRITPILVGHEGGGSFMADAYARITGQPGVLAIVPGAGLSHALSGIGEAYLAGVPMLILSAGIRTDSGRRYQLHDVDQLAVARPLTKAAFRAATAAEVLPAIYDAYRIALSGEPGPVLVELPVNVLMFREEVGELPPPPVPESPPRPDEAEIEAAAALLRAARRPGIFAGWGARNATAELAALAEMLEAPVATTLQGQAVFPAEHPLHAGFSFGPAAVPAARQAFAGCDALLAVGCRFSEIATGSYGLRVPENLVHLDINAAVFDANYPARIRLLGDARETLLRLVAALAARGGPAATGERRRAIAAGKAAYRDEWSTPSKPGRVNPLRFFDALRAGLPDDAVSVVDDGNHTYLTAELFPQRAGGTIVLPTDYNAMGYAVPAAIGAKLAAPGRTVAAVVGDGCFAMTAMEIATAARLGLGILYCVFRDGALSQIAQAQRLPYKHQPCTELPAIRLAPLAEALGAEYLALNEDGDCAAAVAQGLALAARGRPVILDVAIDYSKPTAFTRGVIKTNFARFPLKHQWHTLRRMLVRRLKP